jgi:lambda repressor-like predicted transcriptional regulator
MMKNENGGSMENQTPDIQEMELLSAAQRELFIRLAPTFKSSGVLKSLLILCGVNQRELALRAGCQQSDISKVVKGVRKTRRIREAIAEQLGLTPEELWPD